MVSRAVGAGGRTGDGAATTVARPCSGCGSGTTAGTGTATATGAGAGTTTGAATATATGTGSAAGTATATCPPACTGCELGCETRGFAPSGPAGSWASRTASPEPACAAASAWSCASGGRAPVRQTVAK
ncbi:hypothetical protein [Streptomyces sp. NPDC047981]|uniref:hypothetical protein n=1 Tax=Streptomyces sp. NPDC047981 TaxID=3154610 RepID=UPI0034385FD4